MTRKVEHLIQFEQLEPRILLSGDGLLNIAPDPLQDTLLNNKPLVVQYAELLDTDAQAEEQISHELTSSDTPNSDVYKPIFTLLQDNNTNGESVNADLSVDIVSSTQVNSEPGLQPVGSDIGIALVLGVDLFEENDVKPNGEDVDSECFESCQRQLIIEQLTDTLRIPHGPPDADGVLTSLDDVQLEYIDAGEQIDLVIRLNTQNSTVIEVIDNKGGSLLASYSLSEINSLTVIGGDNSDDILTVDFSNPFSIPGGIIFAGGEGGYDKLVLIGNSELTAEYIGQGDDNGTVIVSEEEGVATNVSYSGLEPFVYLNEFGAVVNSGVFNYGNSPGITYPESLTLTSTSTTVIEIGGRTPGPGTPTDNGYDQFVVTNNVLLAGTLQVVLINNFAPELVVGDTFDFITFGGSLSGEFDDAEGLFGFGDGSLFFDVVVQDHKVQLVVKEAPNIISSTQAINDVLGQFYSDYFTIDSSVTIPGELTIDDFVTLSGSFTFGVAPIQTVTVKTGLPGNVFPQFGATIADVDMLTLTIGAADVHAFVGFNAPYWTGDVDEDGKIDKVDEDLNGGGLLNDGIANPLLDESADDVDYNGDGDKDDLVNEDLDGDGHLDVNETNPDALGLAVTDLDIGFVLMKPDPLDTEGAVLLAAHPLSLFYSLKATADTFEFVGWDEILLSAQQIAINVNNGVKWPGGFGPPVVDFATSYPAGSGDPLGFEVSTGGDPVSIDFGGKKVGFSSERITVQLSQFVHITGSFAFEKGPATSVNIATGLPTDALEALELLLNAATGTDLGTQIKNYGTVIQNVQVSTFQIGASNVHAFVGLNGPYWVDDLDGDGNISWAFNTGGGDDASRTITAITALDGTPLSSVDINGDTYYVGDALPDDSIVTIDAADGWIQLGTVKYGDINGDGIVDANETQELSEEAVGLVVNNLDVGFVTMAPTIGSFAQLFDIPEESLKGIIPKFTALKATADTLRFVGWDEIELSADMITINYQNGTEWLGGLGPPVVDFLNSFPAEITDDDGDGKIDPAGFEVGTGGDPVYIDFDGNQRIGFSSERITLRLSEFVHITGSFAFEMGPVINVNIATGLPTDALEALELVLNAATGTTLGTKIKDFATVIPEVEVATFQIGAADVHAFVGLNGPYWVDDLDGDGNISWAFNTGGGDDASRTIDAITALDGTPLSSVDIDGTTYNVDDVLPPDKVVTLSGSELVTVNGFTYGDIDGDGVVDADETAELSEEAVGLVVNDLDVGFVTMAPTIGSFAQLFDIPEESLKGIIPKFTALKATADSVEFVGFDEVQFSLQGITINYNNGSEWPGGLGPPVVDFLNSFPAEAIGVDDDGDGKTGEPAGFEVGTGGDPVYIDFDGNQRIGAIVEEVTLQISEFVHVTGSIAFEMGPVQTVDVTGGLLSGLTSEAITLLETLGLPTSDFPLNIPAGGAISTELSFMTVGASNVHAFIGMGGPYWVDDLDDDNNISWAFDTGNSVLFPDEASRTINSMENTSITIDSVTYTTSSDSNVLPANTIVTLEGSNGWIEVGTVKYGDIDDDDVVDADETAELSEKAAGIVVNDFDFGMAIMTPTNPLDFARYFALRATAEQVALVGVEGVTLEATKLLVEVNQSSPSIYGLPLFPVVDFAGTSQWASEQLALFDTTPGEEITVGELRVLHGDPATGTSFSTAVGELYATTAPETDVVSLDRVVEVLDTDMDGILTVTEAAVLATTGTAALDADADGDGKIDPLGYEVLTGGDPVYLTMDSSLIRAQGFVELDILSSVLFTGSLAFELGPTQQVTLTNDDTRTVTTMTIGGANITAFVGINGPYWDDLDGDHEVSWSFNTGTGIETTRTISAGSVTIGSTTYTTSGMNVLPEDTVVALGKDQLVTVGGVQYGDANADDEVDASESEELNSSSVGLHITDLDFGIMLMASTNLSELGVFLAAKASVYDFGVVGIDYLTAKGMFDIEMNVGLGVSGMDVVDFVASFPDTDGDGPDQLGFEVNTGDASPPVVLDFDDLLISIQIGGILTVYTDSAQNNPILKFNGLFLFEVDAQGLKLFTDSQLSIGPSGDYFTMTGIGVLIISGDGIAADLGVSVTIGSDLNGSVSNSGAAISGRFVMNTTGLLQTVTVPAAFINSLSPTAQARMFDDNGSIDDDGDGTVSSQELNGILGDVFYQISAATPSIASLLSNNNLLAPASPDGFYAAVAFSAQLKLGNVFDLVGKFAVVVTDTQFDLLAAGSITIGPLGQMGASGAIRINTGAGGGIAGQLFISFSTNTPSTGIVFQASALFELNTTSGAQTIDVFNFNTGIVSSTTIQKGVLIRITGFAEFRINGGSVFNVDGVFVLQVTEGSLNLAIFGNNTQKATLAVGPSGSELLKFEVLGFVAIRDNGFAGHLNLTLNLGLPGVLSSLASFTGQFVLIFNTTGDLIVFEDPGSTSQFIIPKAGPNRPDILATNLNNLFTTDNAFTGGSASPGAYGVLLFSGNLQLLAIYNFSASGYASLTPDGMILSLSISGNFLNLVTISGTLTFNTDGEFHIHVYGGIQLGPDGFNISGSAVLDIKYWDSDQIGFNGDNNKILSITGTLSVSGEIFWINLGTRSLTVSYNSGTGDITVRVGPVPVLVTAYTYIWGIRISYLTIVNKYWTFTVGNFKFNPPPPPVLGTMNNGVLTVNAGSQSLRNARHLLPNEINEEALITKIGAGSTANTENIRLTMFGVSQDFNNVSKVVANMDNGNDIVNITNNVGIAIDTYLGSGDDQLFSSGSGLLSAWGEGDNDNINGGTGNDYLDGGTGEDIIRGGRGLDTVYGGDQDDIIDWTVGDGQDTTVDGEGGEDTLNIFAANGQALQLVVSANGSGVQAQMGAETVNASSVEIVGAEGSNQIDQITVNDLSSSVTHTVNVNLGNDNVQDTVNVNGTSVSDTFNLTVTSIPAPVSSDVYQIDKVGSAKVNLMGIGSATDVVNVNAQAGQDIVNIQTINAETTVNAGTDDDTVNVGTFAPATGGNVNGISARLYVYGEGGSDTLNLDDTGDTADNDGTLTSTMITGLGMSTGITYGTLEHLNINLGSGGDTFTIQSTHTQETTLYADGGADTVNVWTIAGSTIINAGSGSDTINVGSDTSNVSGIAALLTVNGNEPSSGSDIINVDDTGDTSGNTGNLTSTQLHGLGMASGITYGTIETLNISLGSGEDTFTIQSTHSGSTTVSTGAGEDAIVINGADGTLTVNGQAGNDVITVNGTGASSSSTLNGQAGNDIFNIKAINGPVVVSDGVDSDTINVGFDSTTVTVTVTQGNKAPVANDDSAGTPEDTAVTIDVLANDTDVDVDGDPLSVAFVTQGANGTVANNGTNVTYTPAADFNGIDSFTYTASDGNGGFDSATVTVTIHNVAPTLTLSGDAAVDEAATYTLGLASSDPGGDTITGWSIDWGDSSDVQEVTGNPASVTHVYADGPKTYEISATATDEDGIYAAGNTVLVTVDNVAPTIELSGAPSVDEGSPYTLILGAVTDPGADTITEYRVNWGDGSIFDGKPYETFTALGDVTHTYADGPSTPTITVDLVDEDGTHPEAGSLSLTVNNVAPQFEAGPDETLLLTDVGLLSRTITFSDPGDDTWSGTLNFGDDTGDQALAIDQEGKSFDLSHTYTAEGTYDVSVTVQDEDGGSYTDSFQVEVFLNTPPMADAGGPYTIDEGSTLTLDGSGSSDPENNIVSWEWDLDNDGQYDDATGQTTTFTWMDNGSYTAGLKVTDSYGESSIDTATVTVNNVAPTASIVSISDPKLEGTEITVTGSATDPAGANDTLTYDWQVFKGTGTTVFASQTSVEGTEFSFTPDDNESYRIVLTVSDEDGGSMTVEQTITVANVAPTVDAGPDATIEEGSTFASTGNFADPGVDIWTATVEYGDGSGVQSLTLNPDKTFDLSHVYADDGDYTVTVTVTDDDLDVGSDTLLVTVNNVAPAVDAGADRMVDEGDVVNFSGSFTDPGSADTHTMAWDFGDASVASGTLTPSHVYADNGTYMVTLTMTDDDGGVGSDTFTVTVNNVAPTVNAGADQTVNEGDLVGLNGSYSDPGSNDTHTFLWEVSADNGQVIAAGTDVYFSFTPYDNGTYTLTYTVTDDDSASGTDTVVVTVNNVAPMVEAGEYQTVDEGDVVNFNSSFTDPGSADTHTIDWDFGDTSIASGTLTPSHVYADNGIYTITLTVTDDDGGVGVDTLIVAVNNVAPVVDAGADQTANEGTAVSLIPAAFNDLGTLDTHTTTINWGDGSPVDTGLVTESPFGPPGSTLGVDGTVSGSHVYTDDGQYTVTLTIIDDDGGVGTDSLTVTVENVAPTLSVLSVTPEIDENGVVTLAGLFTDPGILDCHTVVIDWADSTSKTLMLAVGERSFSAMHQYLDDNPDGTPQDDYVIQVTLTDDDAGYDNISMMTTVKNVVPQITALSVAPEIDENDVVMLSGQFTDPGTLDNHMVVIDWADGMSDTLMLTVGWRSFSAMHQYLDDDPSGTPQDDYIIQVMLTDDDTGFGSVSMTTTVKNVSPVIVALSNSSPGVGDVAEGEEITIVAWFTDIGTLDSHTAVIDWGDGTSISGQIVESDGSGTVSDSHVYTDGGIYTITISLMDDDEGLAIGTTTAVITGAGIHDGVLQIIGTIQNDHVTVNLSGSRHHHKQFKVHANFLPSYGRGRGYKTFDAADINKIVVLVGNGNDKVTIAGNIKVTAVVDGGAGNDKLKGGGGADILLGAEGKDNLRGGGGRDLLIGGDGSDRIIGNSGDDLLIGGTTLFDIDDSTLGQASVTPEQEFDEALMAILAEWNSERDFETRVNNLKDGSGSNDRLNGSYFLQKGVTVFDDGIRDHMTGSSGKNWLISFDNYKGHWWRW